MKTRVPMPPWIFTWLLKLWKANALHEVPKLFKINIEIKGMTIYRQHWVSDFSVLDKFYPAMCILYWLSCLSKWVKLENLTFFFFSSKTWKPYMLDDDRYKTISYFRQISIVYMSSSPSYSTPPNKQKKGRGGGPIEILKFPPIFN